MSYLFKLMVIPLSLSLFGFASQANGNQCKQQATKIKNEQATKRSNALGAAMMSQQNRQSGIKNNASDGINNGNSMQLSGASVADGCHKALKRCQQDCARESNVEELCSEFKDCRTAGTDMMKEGANTAQQSSNTMGAAGAGIMGAALGALGAMMAKKKKDKKEEETTPASEEPTDDGGGDDVACADRTGGFADSDCASHFVDICFNDQTAANCGDFKNHYCPASGSTGSDAQMSEGNGSQYCNLVTSTDYCQDSANRFSPSCLWIASRGIVCETNPSSSECFPQYTTAELEQACQGLTMDPLCNGLLGYDSSSSSTAVAETEGDTTSGEDGETSEASVSVGFENYAAKTMNKASNISVWHSASKLHEEECKSGDLLECRQNNVPDYIREIENDAKNGYM